MEELSLGEKIKELRKKCGMTQQELAKAIPVSFSTFRRWEKNQHTPDIDEISRLSMILQTPISYFMNNKENFLEKITESADGAHITVGTQTMTYEKNGEKLTVPYDRELSLQILKSMSAGENISIMNGNNNNNAGSIIANVNS